MPSIGQTWVLASIGAVVEMGILSRPYHAFGLNYSSTGWPNEPIGTKSLPNERTTRLRLMLESGASFTMYIT
jgi:hypothetical protein